MEIKIANGERVLRIQNQGSHIFLVIKQEDKETSIAVDRDVLRCALSGLAEEHIAKSG